MNATPPKPTDASPQHLTIAGTGQPGETTAIVEYIMPDGVTSQAHIFLPALNIHFELWIDTGSEEQMLSAVAHALAELMPDLVAYHRSVSGQLN